MTSIARAVAVCGLTFASCTYTAVDVPQPSLVRTTENANCREIVVLDAENSVWTQSACDRDVLTWQRRTPVPRADELRARFAALAEAPPECTSLGADRPLVIYDAYDRLGSSTWQNCETVAEAPWAGLDEAFDAL
ncbi:MAG: hypothetical protein DI536_32925 [Archangium gephyra]|uniref:Lipoprotein n=1 Tax=Archangium gephyra TaxID=48 RepID=A0A2W5V510_9BACT|nr:MAG: hypothetical protein DI536_32925 [Archangium gephyra]